LPNALSLEPAPLAGWQLEFGGLVDTPRKLTGEELAKLPQVEWEMVIQCSGNGRSWFARTVKADGVQWKNGAMGNVKFKGVKLATVVEHLGLKIKPEARFVAVEGADAPEKPGAADFEHSLPLAESLEKSLLVLGMNGEPLPRAHGGPVRLVTAGYYATMHVKWAHKLRFEAEESTNMYHLTRYRTPLKPLQPGEKFTSTLTNSEPNWGMKVKSVIFAPLVGEKIPAGETTLSGVAWNDGAAAIATVEVTTDGGRTWRRAELENSTGPYAWRHWSLRATFPAGEHKVHVRAIDALGRTQPWDGSIHWTPSGYVWNGVDEVAFVAG
jgi:DMSO/TMAO reductase YedYZ molybdopterin-dependent catalytic subunit